MPPTALDVTPPTRVVGDPTTLSFRGRRPERRSRVFGYPAHTQDLAFNNGNASAPLDDPTHEACTAEACSRIEPASPPRPWTPQADPVSRDQDHYCLHTSGIPGLTA